MTKAICEHCGQELAFAGYIMDGYFYKCLNSSCKNSKGCWERNKAGTINYEAEIDASQNPTLTELLINEAQSKNITRISRKELIPEKICSKCGSILIGYLHFNASSKNWEIEYSCEQEDCQSPTLREFVSIQNLNNILSYQKEDEE